MVTDHSQSGEQPVLLELLASTPPSRLLDLGAADGVLFSNSRALIERGWGGVLVEPEPSAFLKLLDLYTAHDDIVLINAAVGASAGLMRFWRTEDLVSTVHEPHFRKWRGAAQYTNSYIVPVIGVWEILERDTFDFVNIDTEGTSAEIGLYLLNDAELRHLPKVICVEHDGLSLELTAAGGRRGYSVVLTNAENLILVRA